MYVYVSILFYLITYIITICYWDTDFECFTDVGNDLWVYDVNGCT